MPLFDLPLAELRSYEPAEAAPGDFDAFWQETLREAAGVPLEAVFVPVGDSAYRLVEVFDVAFAGYGGHEIKGWLMTPAGAEAALPCLVSYVGYGGGRSLPVDHLAPVVAGFAHFVMDTRGQGAVGMPGDTPDPVGGGPQHPGFLTKGIQSCEHYYYRRVFVDAVRAIEAAASHPAVDGDRIAVGGSSQGGGIAIAAGALANERVRLVLADVPFLCHFRRAVEISDRMPYAEIAAFLRTRRDRPEKVFGTLAYFDGIHFAPRISARCLFSVALCDVVCPPSTVFAAYNRVRAEKDIRVYTFNEHEGGGPFHMRERLHALAEAFPAH